MIPSYAKLTDAVMGYAKWAGWRAQRLAWHRGSGRAPALDGAPGRRGEDFAGRRAVIAASGP